MPLLMLAIPMVFQAQLMDLVIHQVIQLVLLTLTRELLQVQVMVHQNLVLKRLPEESCM